MNKKVIVYFIFLISFPVHSAENGANNEIEWFHESELGIVIVGGNNKSQTINSKHKSQAIRQKNSIKINVRYLTNSQKDAQPTRVWSSALRFDRKHTKQLGSYLGILGEGDQAAGYDYRTGAELGSRLNFLKDKNGSSLNGELGYRFIYEKSADNSNPADTRSHFLRIYNSWERIWNDNFLSNIWLEVLPDISDFDNLQINFESSISVVLTKKFSLKLAYLLKFDRSPPIADIEKYDFLYTTTLVAKF